MRILPQWIPCIFSHSEDILFPVVSKLLALPCPDCQQKGRERIPSSLTIKEATKALRGASKIIGRGQAGSLMPGFREHIWDFEIDGASSGEHLGSDFHELASTARPPGEAHAAAEDKGVLVQSYQKMSVDQPLRDRGILVPGNTEDVNKQTARRDQRGLRSNRAS